MTQTSLTTRRALLALLALAGVVTVTTGCQTTKYSEKSDELVEMPDAYAGVEVDGEPMQGWCSDFNAPQLDTLVDRVFRDNMNMRSSWARLKQAEAAARQAGAGRWPMLNVDTSVSRQPFPSLPEGVDVNELQYSVSSAASFEVDLWGRLANQHQAAKLDARAARADAEAMAISLSARVADVWFNLVYQRALERLLEDQMETSRKFLKLTRLRFSRGSAGALDITQQEQQVESLRSRLAGVRATQRVLEHQLSVLVGEPPQNDVTGQRTELPELPARPGAGVPADLLQNRPDVRAAYLRLKAADKRTAAAAKAMLPGLSLRISPFFQAGELAKLFEDLLLQASAALSQPLFQGGRNLAQVDAAEARAEAQLYSWGNTVLQAMQDVQDALVQETQQQRVLESLQKQMATARKSLRLARDRYRNGAATYFRVLTALQSVQSVEQNVLDARRRQLSNRLSLCRALGGSWTEDLKRPSERENTDD